MNGALVEQQNLSGVISVIERCALNPDIDVGKMEKLLDMQERIIDKQAAQAFAVAFAEMQADLPEITEAGEIKVGDIVRSRYAKFEDINQAVKPILKQYGFGIAFRTAQPEGKIIVSGVLTHKSGHREETHIELPADTSGSKNNVQAIGSSISYGKRYTLCDLLNITTRGQDDDATGSDPFATQQQVAILTNLLNQCTASQCKQFTNTYGTVATIKRKDVDMLAAKIRNKIDENKKKHG